MKVSKNSLKWVIYSLISTFYLYEFVLRVSPSIMVPELMKAFSVDATNIGILSAFYYCSYAPMQIPAGMLTDRYGARKLITLASLFSGIGALLFGISENFNIAILGRFLTGFGASFGFVGIVYVATHWFEAKKRGMMIGLANTLGMLGAALGQGPLREMIENFDWHTVTIILSLFGFILMIFIFSFMRDDPKHKGTPKCTISKKDFIHKFSVVVKNPFNWVVGMSAFFFYLTTATFAGLWAIPFVHDTYNISITKSGFIVSMVFIGWAIGGPLIGILSDKLQRRKIVILIATCIGFFLTTIAIYFKVSISSLYILFFLIGFVSSAELICFSYVIDINPFWAKATATSFVNFIIVTGSAIFHPLIGYILDRNWTGEMDGIVRSYSPEAYKLTMVVFPISFILAFLIALFMIKEKRHKSHNY